MTELNINSAKESFNAWRSYLYEGNPNNYTQEQYKAIVKKYSGSLSEWTALAKKEKDENDYHWEDDGSSKTKGYDNAKEKTDFEQTGGKRAEQLGLNSAGMIGGATSLAGGLAGSPLLFKSGMGLKFGYNTGKSITKETTKAAAEKTAAMGTNAAQRTMIVVACFMALATGLVGYLTKPNKEQVDALKKMYDQGSGQGLLVSADQQVNDAESDMSSAEAEANNAAAYASSKSEEADMINASTNEQMTDQKVLYDFYKKSYDSLVDKIKSNKPLEQSEKDLWEACVEIMGQTSGIIDDLSLATTEEVQGIYSDIEETTQTAFDTANSLLDSANTKMAEVDGITQFAASFDKDTKNSCIVQAVSEGVNAAGGLASGIEATSLALANSNPVTFAMAILYYAAAGAAFAGAGLSTKNTMDQIKYSQDVATEIDKRTQTEDLNKQAKLHGVYTIDKNANYILDAQLSQDFIGTLSMNLPTDVDPAEQETLPEDKSNEEKEKTTKKKDKKAANTEQTQTPQVQTTPESQKTNKKNKKV